MIGSIIDIFVAGSETTSYSLGFALLHMIDNPDVQAKVQEEIDRVLQGRQPSISDRGRFVLHPSISTQSVPFEDGKPV